MRVALLSVALPRPYAHASNFVVSKLHARCVAWSVSAATTLRPPEPFMQLVCIITQHFTTVSTPKSQVVCHKSQIWFQLVALWDHLCTKFNECDGPFVSWLRETEVAMSMGAPLVAGRVSLWSDESHSPHTDRDARPA